MISADAENLKVAKDLLAQIDQPELGKDREIEAYVVRNREADEIANLIRAQFPRGQGRPEAQVIVTPQPSTNMVIVSALKDDQPTIETLLKQLDVPPSPDTTKVVTVALKTARADEVSNALRGALPQGLKIRVTPIRRNNTLLLTGSDETIQVVMDQIAKIDVEVDRPLLEFKRTKLKHAIAREAYYTLDQMLRARPRAGPNDPEPTVDYTSSDNTLTFSGTPDQVRDIEKMIQTLDVASEEKRKTEFVKLEYAKAEQTAKALEVFYGRYAPEAATPTARSVTIVPDPASNSLVIAADEGEWEGLRSLLKKLDTEEYDTARQLSVIPLKHADATSVARSLNEGFRAPVEQRLRRDQARQQGQGARRRDEEDLLGPTVLVDNEPTPSVSAEVQTNSLIVFAGRQEMTRIKALVEQIDVPDFVKFPEARIVALQSGKASQIAQSVRELFANQNQQRGGQVGGPRSTVIVGDDVSNSLIIRAEERDFAQIKALAEALQQQGDVARATVRVLTLKNVPAARLQKSLNSTFAQTAKQQNEVLSIEVDRTSNALVIASSRRVYDEIEKVAKELDGAVPGAGPENIKPGAGPLGQTIFIIDVQNNGPEEVRKQLEQLGVTRPQTDDRPGVVSEPVTIVPLTSRRAIAVVASPRDGEAIVSLVRTLDAAPAEPDQRVAVVGLKLATAGPLVTTLKAMLDPTQQSADTGPAKAIAEQVRRLNVVRNGLGQGDLTLDLGKPIRLIPDDQTNSIVIGSTEANIAAVQEIIKTLDSLPSGDAVVIRIFPLTNASATRAKTVIDDLFKQGEELRRIPGTRRQGLPTTATGKALAGEVVLSVDERTNTLVVAGREEAVALVEIVIKDLDSDQAAKWVEPSLIPLKNADAVTLAQTLQQVLVRGLNVTPEALGLQKQVGRLRMAKSGKDANDPANRVEADLFAPLTGLVIQPEPQLNALIVIGSAANNEVVRELVGMLDVEAASAANTVRVFPLEHAAADRVSSIVADIFRQRQADPAARSEDRVIISADASTNSLIVSSSARSFSILDAMLKTLDSDKANNTVALHVVPVIGADAQQLAPRIARLMQDRISAGQRSGEIKSPMDTFSIEADSANNLLIVACSEENLQLVNELVQSLSQGNPALAEAARTELIQIKQGRASDVANTIRQLYVDKENAKRGNNSVNVVPNERLNALIVSGTEAMSNASGS
jgi:type II secretory pathway component GspD/PulD (secretin)